MVVFKRLETKLMRLPLYSSKRWCARAVVARWLGQEMNDEPRWSAQGDG